jgi:formate dehydrogenase maturation protein FdhE
MSVHDDEYSGSVQVYCPYCGAPVEMILDPVAAGEQRYVEDCEVCCRPWHVTVRWRGGHADVELRTEDAT